MFRVASTLVLLRYRAQPPALDVIEGLINLRGQLVTAVSRSGSLGPGKCSPLRGIAFRQPGSRSGAGRF